MSKGAAMIPDEEKRQELFARVWERPMVEVAKEMGISDVALAKRCKNLQVPTPPRGYWARVRAGQSLKRPPLKAFVEELWNARRELPAGQVQLSELQSEFLHRALDELGRTGVDVSACDCSKNLVRKIDPGLAADVIVCVQRKFLTWIPAEELTDRKAQGAIHSVGKLMAKLMPLARRQILLLKKADEGRYSSSDISVLVRVTPDLLTDISRLLSMVRENQLDYIAKAIPGSAHAWSSRYAYSLPGSAATVTQLCISQNEMWFHGVSRTVNRTDEFVSERIRISNLVPEDLLEPEFYELSDRVPWSVLKSFEARISAIEFADGLHSTISNSLYSIEDSAADDTLGLVEKLWFGTEGGGVFASHKGLVDDLGETLETWEEAIDQEKARLVKDVLGVGVGDDVSFTKDGKLVKMRTRRTGLNVEEKEVSFSLSGLRYNQDGLIGKRDEWLHISAPRRSWR